MEQFKLRYSDWEYLAPLLAAIVDTYEQGACFFATDREKVIFKKGTEKFDVPGTEVGTPNQAGGATDQVMRDGKVKTIQFDADVYGVRGNVLAGPLWSDDYNEVLGAWILATPRIHSLVAAFDSFAPLLVEMFPEGGMMYITNLKQIIRRHVSTNFHIDNLQVGDPVDGLPLVREVMDKRKQISRELPAEKYGVPVLAVADPIMDEQGSIIGCFGLLIPKTMAASVREMSENLGKGLTEVSAAMEEMTASASEVAHQQELLNNELDKVSKLASEINQVLVFIKEIADETKMLGLNAAIEAARAGDTGRGFGVVAEEIRRLSDQSKETVVEIRDLIQRIEESIKATLKSSAVTLETTQQQAAATEEVNASTEEMTSLAEQLDHLASEL